MLQGSDAHSTGVSCHKRMGFFVLSNSLLVTLDYGKHIKCTQLPERSLTECLCFGGLLRRTGRAGLAEMSRDFAVSFRETTPELAKARVCARTPFPHTCGILGIL
eukprot:4903567-Amphidinium_carterae.1